MRLTAKLTSICLTVLVCVMFMPVLFGGAVHAAVIGMDYDEYCFKGDKSYEDSKTIWLADEYVDSHDITGVSSTKPSVVKLDFNDNGVIVKPAAVGECTVNVTCNNGDTASFKVIVEKSWFKKHLKEWTDFDHLYYGSKSVGISSLPGTTGKLKIGKKTYKFKVNSKGYTRIKLKKVYKLKTKYTFTIKNSKLSSKPSFTKKVKLPSGTWVDGVKVVSSKKLRLSIPNPTKGDKIKLTYKGKTYTKKIKKSFDGYDSFTFKVKKKLSKKAIIKVKILNKYKQVLDKETIHLSDGIYDPYSDDDLDEE